jgi:hypothetical protein
MTNLEYMEKYGEDPSIPDWAIEEEQYLIDKNERLDNLEKCIERIKELTSEEVLDELKLKEVMEEIKECVESL